MARALRLVAWTCGAVLLACAALAVLILLAANTSSGRAYLAQLTGRLTGGLVQVSGLGGRLPAAIELERLELRDPHGVWLVAEHVSLRWSPAGLLRRHIRVSNLHAARVDLERLPDYPSSGAPESSAGESRLPHIEAQQLGIDVLEVGPELAGRRAILTLQASVRVNSLEDAAVTLLASRLDDERDRYQLRLQFDPVLVDASLAIDEQSGGVLQNLLHLPDLGALHASGELRGPRTAARLQLQARAGALETSAQGTVNLAARSSALDITAHAPAMSPRPDLGWQRLDLTGRLSGPWSRPEADGVLEVEELALPGSVRVAAIRAGLRAHGGILSVQADGERMSLPGNYAALLRDSPLHVEASMRLDSPEHSIALSARHRLVVLTAQVAASAQPSATFDVRLTDLAPLAALAGQQLRGGASLRGTVTTVSAGKQIDCDVLAQLDGPAAVTAVLGRTPRLQASAMLDSRELSISRLQLTAAAGSLTADGRIALAQGTAGGNAAGPPLRAQWTLTVPDLRSLSSLLAGRLTVSGRASGSLNSFAAALQASSELAVRGSTLGTIHASLEARNLPGAPNASLHVRGTFDGEPVDVAATLNQRRDGSTLIALDRAEWKSARAAGQMTVGGVGVHSTGKLQLHMGELEDLKDLIGMPLKGSAAAELSLIPVHGRTDLHLRVAAHDVVVAGIAGNATLTASGPLQTPILRLSAHLPDLWGSPATLNAAGKLDLDKRELHLTELQAAYRQQTPHLLSPADLEFADGLAIKGPRIGVRKAVVSLDGELSPSLALHATAHDIDPGLVNAFVPGLLAQGSISADVEIRGPLRAPLGHANLKAVNLQLADPAVRDLPQMEIGATAKLRGDTADLDAYLEGGRIGRLTLNGPAPLDDTSKFDLKLTGNLDLSLANALLESNGARAAGMLTANLTVTGTNQEPQIGGTLTVTRGDLRDYRLGVHLSAMTGTMIGNHGALQIAQLTANAPPGQLSLSGTVGVLQPGMPVDLQLRAQNATPISSDILTARLDADLRYHGSLRERSDLSGTITVRRADINIPNTFPPNVAVLDVRRRNQAPPPLEKKRAIIGLDMTLSAPRQILVQGRGLSAELGGELQIHGTTDAPVVTGGFDLIRGRFALASGSLNFTAGRVSFDSQGLQDRIDPSLDFTAQQSTTDSTAILRVTGYADSPQFTLSSSPPLPQDEILSRLIFGQSASSLSSMQAAQLGYALVTLTGLSGSGLDVLGRLQKGLGLDRLTVGSINTGSGASQNSITTVEAGRYLSDRVLVTGRESELGTQIGLDVELSRRLRLRTQLGNSNASTQNVTPENDPGTSIGLSYQFEY
jgi:translocation and assembly module TamB